MCAINSVGHATVFIPSFPETIKPTVTHEEYQTKKREEAQLFDRILESLATDVQKVSPSRTYSGKSSNSLVNIFSSFICNLPQIFSDCLTCGSCESEPTVPTYITKENYELLKHARVSFHRNSAALCCCGPIIAVTIPCLTSVSPTVAAGLGILNNISGLMITGCMTYFWGDFGAKELQVYEYLKAGYLNTASYLMSKWNDADHHLGEKLLNQCEQIAKNYDLMVLSMSNFGISKEHAEEIASPLIKVILHIRFSKLTPQPEKVETPVAEGKCLVQLITLPKVT